MYSKKAQLKVKNPIFCSSHEACHDVFTNAFLKAYNYPTGKTGKDQLAQSIKNSANAEGAYLAFFSKYKLFHFAYAHYGGGPTYMQYSNGDWGVDQIDRVFAHETGHVFNAPDEYKNDCSCQELYGKGSCTAKNANCKNCTSVQTSCIMDNNDLSICEHTKKHVGWCSEV